MGAQRYKDNPNAPQIRFIRRNGRIIPIVGGKKKPSLTPLIEGRIKEMDTEIKVAEKGGKDVSYSHDEGTYRSFKKISTFPSWYADIKAKNRGEFHKSIQKQSGATFDKVAHQAIEDLNTGYSTSFGRVPPSMEFRVKAKQTFDNKDVLFRRIDGQVRPLKIPVWKRKDDKVPF